MITLHHHRVGRVFAASDERPHALYDVTRMYIAGRKPPQEPLPVPLWLADTATGWDKLNWTCCPCLCHFTDQLWDDYWISGGKDAG